MPRCSEASQETAEVVIGPSCNVNQVALRQLSDVVLHLPNLAEQLQWIKLRCHLAKPQLRLLGDHRRAQEPLARRLGIVVALPDPAADADLLLEFEGGLEEVHK